MQTAVEWLFDKLKKSDRRIWDDLLEKAKEIEKKQIIDAWEHYRTGSGKRYYNDVYGIGNILSPTYSGENPFIPIQTEIYVSKGIDKTDLKKLITEIMEEDAKDELYDKPFVVCEDCGMEECKCYQTEISDEEYYKDVFYQKQVMNPYPTGDQSYTAYEKGFMDFAKWYREQLKLRQ